MTAEPGSETAGARALREQPADPRVRERLESRVRRVDAAETIARLEVFVARMERRYGCSSEEMTERVRAGRQPCTREISTWLPSYRDLISLRAALAAADGMSTVTTASSTKTSSTA